MTHPSKRRHWCCTSCGIALGAVRASGAGRYLFATVYLHGAIKADDQTGVWTLTCVAGHETEWRGAGINWWANTEAEGWTTEPGARVSEPGTTTTIRAYVEASNGNEREAVTTIQAVTGHMVRNAAIDVLAFMRQQQRDSIAALIAEREGWEPVGDVRFWYRTEDVDTEGES